MRKKNQFHRENCETRIRELAWFKFLISISEYYGS